MTFKKSIPWYYVLALVVLLGWLGRSYGLFAPWGQKDHYNFGGPFQSRYAFCITESLKDPAILKETRARMHLGCPEEKDPRKSPLFSALSQEDQVRITQRAQTLKNVSSPDSVVKRAYYINHPPFYPWLMVAMVHVFGEHEWVFRSVTLVFSVLNILLVGLLARKIFASNQQAIFAAVLQAGFLGPLYFGTHVDYMNEINGTFLLLSTLSAVSGQWLLACLAGMVSGLTDWPGFFILGGLFLLSLLKREGRFITSLSLLIGLVSILGTAGFLVGPSEAIALFHNRISNSGHVPEAKSWAERLYFPALLFQALLRAHSRLLGPVFFATSLVALFGFLQKFETKRLAGFLSDLKTKPSTQALFLMGFTMVVTIILGAPYVIIHPFWFMPTLSFWALWIASNWHVQLNTSTDAPKPWITFSQLGTKTTVVASLIVAIAFYSFGIHKSHPIFDAFVSLLVATSVLLAIYRASKSFPPLSVTVITVAIIANMLQVINYRTEPAVDRDFCLQALTRYARTGEPITLDSSASWSRWYYCRGIPQTK